MPVRDKAVTHIASLITGTRPDELGHVRGMRREVHDLLRFAADDAYEKVVEAIDWNRVYLDASARHLSLHKDPDEDKDRTLVTPSEAALEAGLDAADDVPYVPPPAWHNYRYDDLCPECIMHAVLANDWGGKAGDKWKEHPVYPRWRFGLRPRHPELKKIVLELIAWAWARPEEARGDELDTDGHMPTCYEVGRARESRMVCDPRCPEYDGWAEDVADKIKVGGL